MIKLFAVIIAIYKGNLLNIVWWLLIDTLLREPELSVHALRVINWRIHGDAFFILGP